MSLNSSVGGLRKYQEEESEAASSASLMPLVRLVISMQVLFEEAFIKQL